MEEKRRLKEELMMAEAQRMLDEDEENAKVLVTDMTADDENETYR